MRLVLIIVPAVLMAGCGRRDSDKTEAESAASPVAVQTVEARRIDWPVSYEAPGTVRARTATTLSSRIMGYVREIRVQPGDRVSAGQMLVVIDSRDLESSVRQAQAAEAEARSAIGEADNGVAAAKAQLALAQATFRRMESLYKQKSISDQEFDEAQARVQTAEATLEMARSKRSQIDAKTEQAKQSVESATLMQSFTRISAPFAGVVTEKPAQIGQLATPGMPLVTVEQTGGYRLEAPVEESLLGSIRSGQRVRVALDAYGQTLEARVDEIVPAVDAPSRAFLVKASLPPSANLRSGLFGRLLIDRGVRQAIVVPAAAISQRGELQAVFVAENGVARMRMVTAGSRRGDQTEVLSGLAAGDRIIYPRPPALTDGTRVEVR
jgi:RND family efflux transporter MFP subunit